MKHMTRADERIRAAKETLQIFLVAGVCYWLAVLMVYHSLQSDSARRASVFVLSLVTIGALAALVNLLVQKLRSLRERKVAHNG
jgi:hypothetical protein